MPSAATSSASAWRPELKWAGVLLGMALGGFFDGILLHQILQWHHLLSAVQDPPWLDLRMQLLIDGFFHALMHGVLAAGLVLLVRSRQELALDRAHRYVWAGALTGFGLWNLLDGMVFHGILQIHHIRMEAANPWLWDLAWFAVFGAGFAVLGWRLQRGGGRTGGGAARGPARAAAAGLALLVSAAGWQAAQAPDTTGALYRSGALMVSSSAIALGCLSWSRPPLVR